MEERQHITIHIADASPLDLKIPRAEEETVRQVVSNINMLWKKWGKQYPNLSSKDVLAMCAYQYAKLYHEQLAKTKAQESELASAERALDKILLDVK